MDPRGFAHDRLDARRHAEGMSTTSNLVQPGVPRAHNTTAAFYVQAAISFGLALTAVVVGVAFLPVSGWVRAFLGLGVLYTVTSAFTLAKCVRDRQHDTELVSRVDQARLDHYLAEHDPLRAQV